jgi:riboflavin kinase/FMN adenylyltransferase
MLGRPFRLEGHVVTGDGRGGKLGFPTANLDLDAGQALPADGVYAGWAYTRDRRQAALLNIGVRPTFGAGRRIVELYILDFEGDLYGSHLIVDIIERLRGEVRFSSADELKKQIETDIEKGRAILK